jgi:peptide/nickel transport system permease protein
MLLGGFIAPYDYAVQNRDYSFVPPTRIHFVDALGNFHFRPFVYASQHESPEYGAGPMRRCFVRFLVHGSEYKVAGFFRTSRHLFGVDEPGRIFLLGTDKYGRDQLARLLRGGQISLLAGLVAAALSIAIGLSFGTIAGYYGPFADAVIMRTAELFLVLPWLYLLLAVKAFLPLNLGPATSFLLVVAVIGVVGWARPARLIRGVVLSEKERNYVIAAQGFGATKLYVLRRHILPRTAAVVLTQATLLVPAYSLSEMTLSFLGLGVSEPVPSWGNMLASLQQYHVLTSYWWMFLPALPAILVFWGYYILTSGLQEQSQ